VPWNTCFGERGITKLRPMLFCQFIKRSVAAAPLVMSGTRMLLRPRAFGCQAFLNAKYFSVSALCYGTSLQAFCVIEKVFSRLSPSQAGVPAHGLGSWSRR